ncbi:uncharacterized protein K460DRAFT_340925 [Cucurbitaria berberidis CBS 394.84]|uniref:Uncharacterized protein n=1 Tax=Cucurbitaria berberidis CBS 394.84 TaxID=1168544 RepID=A0A9P4GCT2_9PLEO|nr:uncharacterized protein K460DRAFT_340925 [Cucurbitaria berberidis CBS 394.84]KAF1843134.1 hypothetical protein K460DRAFT_340925 [Cucurbitaria berberidis CBS 394.84]
MSGSSTFWAQKRNLFKSANLPLPVPTTTESPKPAENSPPTKKSLVSKGMTNGAAKTSALPPNGKKTDWADSEDDDEFTASFTKTPRVITLENEVARKDARIGELEAVVGIKAVRISQLEGLVEEKDHDIANLETRVAENYARIEEFKKEGHEQYLHVQELLEAELEQKCSIIRDLEVESDSQTQVSTEDMEMQEVKEPEKPDVVAAEPAEPQAAIAKLAKVEDEVSNVSPTTTADVDGAGEDGIAHDETSATTATEPSTTEPPKETASPKEASGLAFGESDFPIFVTQENIKVAPPSKAPKKLTFPIDFSKYGKKLATAAAKQPEAKKDKGAHATSGLASKQQRTKTDAVPNFNPSLDIRQMSHAERIIYANGPEVAVQMGDVKLATLPKYVLMQCSGKAYKHFTNRPDAISITFPVNSMDVDAARAHLSWMDEMTYQGRVYSIALNADPKFDQKNLNICRAARVLGMNNTYIGHFTKQFCDRIRENEASADFMGLVCDLAYAENDPIFECLANNLASQVKRQTVQKPEELAALLAKHETLKTKMEEIEKRIAKKR